MFSRTIPAPPQLTSLKAINLFSDAINAIEKNYVHKHGFLEKLIGFSVKELNDEFGEALAHKISQHIARSILFTSQNLRIYIDDAYAIHSPVTFANRHLSPTVAAIASALTLDDVPPIYKMGCHIKKPKDFIKENLEYINYAYKKGLAFKFPESGLIFPSIHEMFRFDCGYQKKTFISSISFFRLKIDSPIILDSIPFSLPILSSLNNTKFYPFFPENSFSQPEALVIHVEDCFFHSYSICINNSIDSLIKFYKGLPLLNPMTQKGDQIIASEDKDFQFYQGFIETIETVIAILTHLVSPRPTTDIQLIIP